MHKEKINILSRILGGSYRSGKERLYACPKCRHHKKKLSVNFKLDKYKCWVCEYAGRSIRSLVRVYGNTRHLSDWDLIDGPSVDITTFRDIFDGQDEIASAECLCLPSEFETLTGKTTLVASPIKKYLLNRGVTQEDIVHWKMGYCATGEYKGRIVIPSFSLTGELNYFVARSYDNNWKKYMNPPSSRNIIFNELMIDWDLPIVLVEGVFDAIIAGTNAIPLLGSQLREDSKLFQRIAEKSPKVFLALDPDVEKKSSKIIKKMLTYGAELAKIEVRPYSDVGEMSKEEFQERKQSATPVSKSFGDYFSYLLGRTVKI